MLSTLTSTSRCKHGPARLRPGCDRFSGDYEHFGYALAATLRCHAYAVYCLRSRTFQSGLEGFRAVQKGTDGPEEQFRGVQSSSERFRAVQSGSDMSIWNDAIVVGLRERPLRCFAPTRRFGARYEVTEKGDRRGLARIF